MDLLRLRLFNRALREMTDGACDGAIFKATVTEDLGLAESQACDVICRFLMYIDDVQFLLRSGLLRPEPREDQIQNADRALWKSMVANIPVSAGGARVLYQAIQDEKFIKMTIMPTTTVVDVIAFAAAVERMEGPHLDMPNLKAAVH